MGSYNSIHNKYSKLVVYLMNVNRRIDKFINRESSEKIQKNRLRSATTTEIVCWLSLQACEFSGHNQSSDSQNIGNFIDRIKILGK